RQLELRCRLLELLLRVQLQPGIEMDLRARCERLLLVRRGCGRETDDDKECSPATHMDVMFIVGRAAADRRKKRAKSSLIRRIGGHSTRRRDSFGSCTWTCTWHVHVHDPAVHFGCYDGGSAASGSNGFGFAGGFAGG